MKKPDHQWAPAPVVGRRALLKIGGGFLGLLALPELASAAVRNDWFFLGGGFEVEVEFFFLSEERKKRRHRRCFLYLSLFLAFSRFLFSLLCRGRIRKR